MKSCLTIETLVKYIRGNLPENEKSDVESHLSRCDACLEEFVGANEIMKDGESSDTETISTEAARNILRTISGEVRQFFQWITAPPSEPNFAHVRKGTETHVTFVRMNKDFDGLNVELFVEKMPDDKVGINVNISTADDVKNIRLTIRREGKIIHSRRLKNGKNAFENMAIGEYRLTFQQFETEVGSLALDINVDGIDEK